MLPVTTVIMNSRFLMPLQLLLVLFMFVSLMQLLALTPETVTVKCIEREREALVALKQGFELNNDSWLSSWGDAENQEECCNWEGIQCSNQTGHILKLDLHASDHVRAGWINPSLGELRNLNYLDLSFISFNNTPFIPDFIASLTLLSHLSLSHCGFHGQIPHQLGSLILLEYLDLGYNGLVGEIPIPLFHICSLRQLDLSQNKLTGKFHEFVQAYSSRCSHNKSLLESLDMRWNQITGMVPDLSHLSSLQVLRLDGNELNGTIHESIGQLSNLMELRLGNNSLEGFISEAHFSILSILNTLDLSHNKALMFNVSTEWVPKFDLIVINLASCTLGPGFPTWLQTQKNIIWLDISHAEISGTVPNWFWDLLPRTVKLNLSHNHIEGNIENSFAVLQESLQIDISTNSFEGPVPALFSVSAQVFLSNNSFSTVNLFLCANRSTSMEFLDLSSNHLTGELPDCWVSFQSLGFLDLSDNYFAGKLPWSIGSIKQIQSLHMGGNNFSGDMPLSLINCTKLQAFDASHNNFSGPLPIWIGDNVDPKLLVLSLRSNKFHGSMPLSICNLNELHLLDLSLNNLSGKIPKCISNFSAMASQTSSNTDIFYAYDGYYDDFNGINFGVHGDSASLIWKGKMSKFRSTLGLLRSIDFSSNQLTGEIPSEITSLIGLISLNVSRNMLSGEIPPTIGQLKSIDFLDLSRNQLSGRIPSQLSQLDRLSVLDLSYNDLSGEIPLGTQIQTRDADAYMGNPKLCGAPLNKTCPVRVHDIDGNEAHVADQIITEGFYIAMATGFIMGFWGVCFSLIFKKSWKYAYFKFFSDVYDKLHVLAAIKIAKLQRIRS